MKRKRYILFAGDNFYPNGGVEDFFGTFDSVEEAQKAGRAAANAERPFHDWYHVMDTQDLSNTLKCIYNKETKSWDEVIDTCESKWRD